MFKDRIDLYKKIEDLRESKLLVFITGDRPGFETQIHSEVLDYFIDHLDCIQKSNRISLFLYTRGGNTLAAWSLVNLISQFCDDFEVIIPDKAHSAGTLISLGAKRIVMTKQSTLGPIDPSLNSPLNPQNPMAPNNPGIRIPVSVESINGYLQLAQNDLKINKEENLKDVLLHLSNYVHPLVLGDVYRSQTQIKMLAKKLLERHINDTSKIKKIISFLCSDSGSHDYTIYRREAKNELGLTIEKPNDEFYEVIKKTIDDIKSELEMNKLFDPGSLLGGNASVSYTARRSLIESLGFGSHVFESSGVLNRISTHDSFGQIVNTIEDQRAFEGWKVEKIN